jgi:hypothetical protein
MEFKWQGLCLTALMIALVIGEASAQTTRRSPKEQSHFGAEVAIRKATEIPTDVLSILREDKRNETCLKDGESRMSITSSWFVGSKIHLNGNGDADLVVTARNKCLLGANLVPFWVFRSTPQGHELILSVSALGLEVLDSTTNDYRDIQIGAATARRVSTSTLKFDGKRYQPAKQDPGR